MIKSCKSCRNSCCRTGPGPYTLVTPEEYLENFSTTDSYDTQCMALGEDGKCTLWGQTNFPVECRVHICTHREFSKLELETIDQVDECRSCKKCEASYVLLVPQGPDEDDCDWLEKCENCGYTFLWARKEL